MHNGSERKALFLVLVVALLAVSCSGNKNKSQTANGNATQSAKLLPMVTDVPDTWSTGSEAGVSWRIPVSWAVGPEAPMRAGTYFAASVDSDGEQAECRVNFFGQGQGGSVEQNIARWVGQMEVEGQQGVNPQPATAETQVNGMRVTVMELEGTYLFRESPMAGEITRKPGFVMYAAIVEAPEGSVFFKMTGPHKTMEAQRELFQKMIGSVDRTST